MPLAGCDPNSIALGSVGATEVMAKKSVDLLVSSRCAEEAKEIGRMAFFAKMPVMNRCGYSVETYDRQLYPTVVQTVDLPVATMAMALGRLMASLGQKEVSLAILLHVVIIIIFLSQLVLVGPKSTSKEQPSLVHALAKFIRTYNSHVGNYSTPEGSSPLAINLTNVVEVDAADGSSLSDAAQQLRSPTKSSAYTHSHPHNPYL